MIKQKQHDNCRTVLSGSVSWEPRMNMHTCKHRTELCEHYVLSIWSQGTGLSKPPNLLRTLKPCALQTANSSAANLGDQARTLLEMQGEPLFLMTSGQASSIVKLVACTLGPPQAGVYLENPTSFPILRVQVPNNHILTPKLYYD